MAGTLALPRWNPENPTTYTYDWRQPYDRADYQKFKEARAAADKARYEKSERDLKQAMKGVAKTLQDRIASELQKSGPLRGLPSSAG
jgi:hypothetical protein